MSEPSAGAGPATTEVAAQMAEAALGLLGLLDADQRAAANHPFPAEDERRRWFYTPTDHGGLALADMSARQHQSTHRLLATGLSRPGYVTAATVMGLENVLDAVEGWTASWGRERGRDPLLYWVRVFGDPAASEPWGWRFGGHHVSVAHTIVDGAVVASTPLFLGADPASAPLLGPHPLRPLEGVEETARTLLGRLDPGQLAHAVISPVAPADLVTGNRSTLTEGDRPPPLADVWRGRFDGELGALVDKVQTEAEAKLGLTDAHVDALSYSARPKGLAGTDMSPAQRDGLAELIGLYLGRLPDELAEAHRLRLGDGLTGIRFAWAGPAAAGEPHYYRLQGERLLIEYDNTQRDANHAHSVLRDPVGDFGDDVLARHYRDHPHHS